MSFEVELQTAVFTALDADSALSSLVIGVYDDVPQPTDAGDESDFPYVTVGEAVHTEFDTDNTLGDDCTITVHSWSRYAGRKEIKQIQGAVYNVLHRSSLPVSGYTTVGVDWVQSDSFVDTDGETRHGVQTFRIILDEV